jgi:hypothetical protein
MINATLSTHWDTGRSAITVKLAQRLAKERVVDPVKRAERDRVDARNRRLQERGVPQPKSGTFGKPPK